ncbi:hypothetical protein BH23ACT12_BH23ACT12_09190 [soil metagenome]
MWAQAELRKVLDKMGARVMNEELAVGQAHNAFRQDGTLQDSDLGATLDDLLVQLVAEAGVMQRSA